MILENLCTEIPMRCCLGEYIHLMSGCWAATGDSAMGLNSPTMIPPVSAAQWPYTIFLGTLRAIWPGSIWIHSTILCQFVAWFILKHLINGRIKQDPKIHGGTTLPYAWPSGWPYFGIVPYRLNLIPDTTRQLRWNSSPSSTRNRATGAAPIRPTGSRWSTHLANWKLIIFNR
jgi:hypothetical protein